jgi:hypothetical protein
MLSVTPRQYAIIRLTAQGKTSREVGAILGIAEGSVRVTLSNQVYSRMTQSGNMAVRLAVLFERGEIEIREVRKHVSKPPPPTLAAPKAKPGIIPKLPGQRAAEQNERWNRIFEKFARPTSELSVRIGSTLG